eukprot:3630459-Lingulodinium_polyedra.AAC.1
MTRIGLSAAGTTSTPDPSLAQHRRHSLGRRAARVCLAHLAKGIPETELRNAATRKACTLHNVSHGL